MRMRLFLKIVLLYLTNQNRLKKKKRLEKCMKSVCDYCGIHLMLHTSFYYYAHKNFDFLGVWRLLMFYHGFNNLAKQINGDLVTEIRRGI